ncbi:xylulokinase [Xanthomonas campestris]|uniref:xylulokinase n=1 Tax=Xanthomonas campestris TaxID=339 RepID=UPI000E324B75|nr:xylulokinase [Xanthomonas campestris]MCC5048038.1 xylulokinase [Xanthomonas campestris]MCC5057287.1 xylulokinase [Xanthomonas campestris]MCC5061645.1 xylulokinase [Xanthomonas campestris]MEA0761351.1 xylulokinase [Xanthomonas campestris pv. campestris]MEA9562360.1 xylulokinase [Xanthomonas campestris]
MSVYVGLDVGTQSVKLVAYDPQKRAVVATIGAPMELISRDDGTREQQAQWWIDGIVHCFAQLDAELRARVRGISVSGQQHGFVPVAADGSVTAPVKLWCDTSTALECDEIMDAVGGAAGSVATAGNPIMAGYTASKLPWTRKHRPEAYAAMTTVMLPHDYVNFWLTGERFTEVGDASGTGWLDVRTRQWSERMLGAMDAQRDLRDALPPLVETGAVFALSDAAAEALALPAGVRVTTGGGDNMMAAIGTGNVVPGRLTMSLGTSGTLFAYADHPVVDDDARWAAFCSSSGGWLPLICTMNCTVATEAVMRMFSITRAQTEAMIADTTPGADGLVLLPFFNGERTPNLPDARGCLFGMDLHNTTPAHFYRAAMEGATYSLRNGFDAFVAAGLQFDTILLTGGGSKSAQWRQMVADVFNLQVVVPTQPEGAAFGAALQAVWACDRDDGGQAALSEVVLEHLQIDDALSARPDPQRVAAYQQHYQNFLKHLHVVSPLYAG